jgi:plastocyanin
VAPIGAVTAFHVLGGLLAVWALIVAFLGITRREFPGGGGRERLVGAISATLALAAISSAIIVAATEDEEEGKSEAAPAGAEKPPPGGGQQLKLAADPSGKLAFDKKSLEAKPGPVTLVMSNPAQLEHDISVEGAGVDQKGKIVGKGGTSTVSADLKPGKYTFYCSVPGHRAGGMEGTLTVK